MTHEEIAILIKEHYNYIEEPTEVEIRDILLKISKNTTEVQPNTIIHTILTGKTTYVA